MDLFSYKSVYGTLLVMQIVLSATVYWAANSKASFFIWVCLILLCESGHFTIMPTVCAGLFGARAPDVFSIAFSAFGLSSLFGSLLVKVLLPAIGY